MNKLFGLPVDDVALVLAAALGIALGVVAVLALRNRVLLPARRAQRPPTPGAQRPDRRRLDARHDDHRRRARHRRHHEPHDPLGRRSPRSGRRTRSSPPAESTPPLVAREQRHGGIRYFPQGDADRIGRGVARLGPRRRRRARDRRADRGAGRDSAPERAARDAVRERPRAAARLRRHHERRSHRVARRSAPGEVYLNAKAADKLDARRRRHAAHPRRHVRQPRCASGPSSATTAAARPTQGLLMPLAPAQRLLGKPGLIERVFVSNRGRRRARPIAVDRAAAADARAARARGRQQQAGRARAGRPAGRRLHVHVHDVRLVLDRRRHPADLPDLRDARGRAPRRARHRAGRSARAASHLVQMFLFEGLAYDLSPPRSAPLLGVAVAYVMVLVMAGAFGTSGDVTITYAVDAARASSSPTRSACC